MLAEGCMASRYAEQNNLHYVGGAGHAMPQPPEEGEVFNETESGDSDEKRKGEEIKRIIAAATAIYEYGPVDNLQEYEVTPINVTNVLYSKSFILQPILYAFRQQAINSTVRLVQEYRDLYQKTTRQQLRFQSIDIPPPKQTFEITKNYHKETQTDPIAVLSANETENINKMFGATKRPTLAPDDIVVSEGTHHAASDATLDKLHGIIFVAYAVVFGPFSRYNFDDYLPFATSTLEGETIGLREGIMFYFNQLATETSKLCFYCDNLAAVENCNNLIRYAQGGDFDSEYLDFQIGFLGNGMHSNQRMMEYLEVLRLYGHRLQVQHVRSHVALPHTIPQHLNAAADRHAKAALSKRFKEFPIMSEESAETSETYLQLLTQQGTAGLRF